MDKFTLGIATGVAVTALADAACRWWKSGYEEAAIPGVAPVELLYPAPNPEYLTDFPALAPIGTLSRDSPNSANKPDLKAPAVNPVELVATPFASFTPFRSLTEKHDSGICHICLKDYNRDINRPWPRLGLGYRYECTDSLCGSTDTWKCPYCNRKFHNCDNEHGEAPTPHRSTLPGILLKTSLLALGVYYLYKRC